MFRFDYPMAKKLFGRKEIFWSDFDNDTFFFFFFSKSVFQQMMLRKICKKQKMRVDKGKVGTGEKKY